MTKKTECSTAAIELQDAASDSPKYIVLKQCSIPYARLSETETITPNSQYDHRTHRFAELKTQRTFEMTKWR